MAKRLENINKVGKLITLQWINSSENLLQRQKLSCRLMIRVGWQRRNIKDRLARIYDPEYIEKNLNQPQFWADYRTSTIKAVKYTLWIESQYVAAVSLSFHDGSESAPPRKKHLKRMRFMFRTCTCNSTHRSDPSEANYVI